MRKIPKCIMLFVLVAGSLSASTDGAAAGELIKLSTATFSNGEEDTPYGLAVDGLGNIIMAGYSYIGGKSDFLTVKYDESLNMISSVTFNGLADGYDYAYSVAVDSSNNIIVAGYAGGANDDFLMIKYDQNLTIISSATFNGAANQYDRITAVTVDTADNIIVTGISNNAVDNDILTIKYDLNLVLLASATYDSVGHDNPSGVVVDSAGNIFVAGSRNSADWLILKYGPDLNLLGSQTFNSGGDDVMTAMALDGSGNIVVAGHSDERGNNDYRVHKYNANLVLLSSATYDCQPNSDDQGGGVAVDSRGNIILTGSSNKVSWDFFTIRCNPDLTVVSSAVYAGASCAYAATVDQYDNIIVAGDSDSDIKCELIQYKGPAAIASVTPSSNYNYNMALLTIKGGHFVNDTAVTVGGQTAPVTFISSTTLQAALPPGFTPGTWNVTVSNPDGSSATLKSAFTSVEPLGLTSVSPASVPLGGGTTVTLTGSGFTPGAAVLVGDRPATGVNVVSTGTITCVTPRGASTGAKDVTVTLLDSQTATLEGGLTYYYIETVAVSTGTRIDPSTGGTATIQPESGNITVDVPGGAFGTAVTLNIATATVPVSNQGAIKVTSVGIEITNSGGLQPSREIVLTVYYRDADITGLDESKLTLARYDNGRWIPIPTLVYADQNKLAGTVKHLSTFAVVQLAPAADLAGVKVYPNPFDPKNGSLTIANLTGEAEIKIYNVAGELVRTLPYTLADGQAAWDGKNDAGNNVASGIYLVFIKSSAGKKILKIAVER